MIPEWFLRWPLERLVLRKAISFCCLNDTCRSENEQTSYEELQWLEKSDQYAAFLMLAWAQDKEPVNLRSRYEENDFKRLHAETKNDA